jgi:hypothetical protein
VKPAAFSLPSAVLAAATLLGGCAPDAWNSAQGVDAWIGLVAQRCTGWIANSKIDQLTDNNSYFLDQMSKLYYGRTTPQEFRDGVAGFVDPSPDAMQTVACIIAQRPAVAPKPPPIVP